MKRQIIIRFFICFCFLCFYQGLDPAGFDPDNADVNCSGGIDIIDALLIARYYVSLIDSFC